MCVNTIDGKFYVFHSTAICYWRQFDDSMEGYIQVWQIIWKSNVFFPSKQLEETMNWHKQIRIVLLESNYHTDCIYFETVCIFCYFISRKTIWPQDFKSDLMEPRKSFFECHACGRIFLFCMNGVLFLNIHCTNITSEKWQKILNGGSMLYLFLEGKHSHFP